MLESTVHHGDADAAVRKLSDGFFRLECRNTGIYLVKTETNERVRLPHMVQSRAGDAERLDKLSELSERELEVFTMLGDVMELGAIANRLGISVKTAETYRARIKQKLDVKSGHDLLALAIEWRLNNSSEADENESYQTRTDASLPI